MYFNGASAEYRMHYIRVRRTVPTGNGIALVTGSQYQHTKPQAEVKKGLQNALFFNWEWTKATSELR
jgi:hypothetical protein